MSKTSSGRRIHFLDELRGFDILLMICFHAFYTMGWVLDLPVGVTLFRFFAPVEPFFAGIFVFICGICSRFSHNNWLRGGMLALVAVGISVVMQTVLPEDMIWFGVLHMLAVSILLFALLHPLFDRIPAWLGLLVSGLIAFLCWNVPGYNGSTFGIPGVWQVAVPSAWVNTAWLYPLGLGFFPGGSDYFPLLPWFFVFLAGSFVGVWAKAGKFPKWMSRSHIPFLATVGRHSLLIYVLHQPIIYGIGKAVLWIVEQVG